jgi:mannose-1-phosphate guanylyltransferase
MRVLVVAPSDHIILKEEVFSPKKSDAAIRAASENDWLVTLGIKPSRPDTGYGYIQFNKNINDDRYEGLSKVKTFTEKPNHRPGRHLPAKAASSSGIQGSSSGR